MDEGMAEDRLEVAKRVLVVEDNELNLKLFCDLLRAHEFVVEPVRDGREAVARARDFLPDLVVMDIQMPHVTGYELILELKADEATVLVGPPLMAAGAVFSTELRGHHPPSLPSPSCCSCSF